MSLEFDRHFSLLEKPKWARRKVGDRGFEVEFPESWSATAAEIACSKYFRKGETSLKHLIHRVAHTIREAGEWQGYFADAENADIFEEELTALLVNQIGAFNSPVWFNCGLFPAYGSAGKADAYAWDFEKKKIGRLTTAFIRPQLSACFIQRIDDDLLSIFDLLRNEAKLFKYGSGTGTNFSPLRAKGESIDGGPGTPGLLSYLEIFDRAAQVMRSGGTTRRAAKMVVLDADHPEILEFIQWKVSEERKARVLVAAGYSTGFDGEAFRTISGQNSNNSVRLTDEFMQKVKDGGEWELKWRTNGNVSAKLSAGDLFDKLCKAAWECADPGVQFHDTIQKHHMCPSAGAICASNPCSEFLFLDDSACNLASLNLVKFFKDGRFDWDSFEKANRLFFIAQDIIVDYASYPTEEIAENSHRYRPLGLGYANLGGLLMQMAIPYDSELAAEWTAMITAKMHFTAMQASCDLAKHKAPFEGFEKDREACGRVLKIHLSDLEKLTVTADLPLEALKKKARTVVEEAAKTGLRNAQLTLLAPTGTIGLFMDCDTLGIEPDFALLKVKNLVGGQVLKLANQSVEKALTRLGYQAPEKKMILDHLVQNGSLVGAPNLKPEHLSIFDTAVPPTNHKERLISWRGHLRIMAAAQPFLSGGISKTVNLPRNATAEDVKAVYLSAYERGLKSVSVYVDGAKSLQPLCLDC
jgi:ribonucleoside-diphosphate reductase alpha chain